MSTVFPEDSSSTEFRRHCEDLIASAIPELRRIVRQRGGPVSEGELFSLAPVGCAGWVLHGHVDRGTETADPLQAHARLRGYILDEYAIDLLFDRDAQRTLCTAAVLEGVATLKTLTLHIHSS